MAAATESCSRSFAPVDIAVVTGASRGIGAAIARELASQGAPVVVNYRSDAKAAAEIVDDIRSSGGKAVRLRADVRDEGQVIEMFGTIRRQLGMVRLLVNNAGVKSDGYAATLDGAEWRTVIDTNLNGAFYCAREALKSMIIARSGAIVNITSVSGIIGIPGQVNYSASKAGVIGFTRALARESGQLGIRVNAVAPGLVETDMLVSLPRRVRQQAISASSLGRMCTAGEVAAVVAFLLSRKASGVTGQIISVDGGMSYG